MRELKFRVWSRGKMYYFDLFENDQHYLLSETGGNIEFDAPVMQYAGVYDMDDKRVYEGDITDDGYVIEFKCGAFLESREGYESVLLGADQFTPSCGLFAGDNGEVGRVRIVGNIYENPELLEGREC